MIGELREENGHLRMGGDLMRNVRLKGYERSGDEFDRFAGRQSSVACDALDGDRNRGLVLFEDGVVAQRDLNDSAARAGEELLDLLVPAGADGSLKREYLHGSFY